MSKRRTHLIYGLAALVGIALAFGFVYYEAQFAPSQKPDGVQSFGEEKQRWIERIRAIGGEKAHAELVESLASSTPEDMHYMAHVFGSALYTIEGVDGIVACDGKYLYGCAHAFVMRGLEEEGTSAIPKLNQACLKRFGSEAHQCRHGIGHGILGELGYTKDALIESLRLCDPVSESGLSMFWGCRDGVFMEYNLRWMEDLRAKPRPFVSKEAFWEPCSMVSMNDAIACAYWQPMWWMLTALKDEPAESQARTMGQWCNEATDDLPVHSACIAGIAYRMPQLTAETPAKTAHFCAIATDTDGARQICQWHAAVRFTYYYPLDVALQACEGLETTEAECRKSATETTAKRRAQQTMEFEI